MQFHERYKFNTLDTNLEKIIRDNPIDLLVDYVYVCYKEWCLYTFYKKILHLVHIK